DIIVFGKDEQEHHDNLEKILTRLAQFELYIKPKKWRIGHMKLGFMGYVVSERGVEMDTDCAKAIQVIPAPTTVKGMQRFLGVVNYSRRFIPAFARKTWSLQQLLRTNGTKIQG
ncbi:MAG: hypothetical protein ACK53Y_04385, partial [bacterium]